MDTPRIVTRHFSRDLLLVFLVISAVVVAAVSYLSTRARHDISQKYIDGAAKRAVGAFQALAETTSRDLKLIRDWGLTFNLSLADTDGLKGLLFPILKRDRIIFGISVADTDGESFYVVDVGDGWRTSRTGKTDDGRGTVRRIWDADRNLISEETKASVYDPRQRPWFFPALSTKGVFWTPPYQFYDRKDVGITASIAVSKASEETSLVIALDILLDDLFREIQRMGPSENSRVFIFRRDAQLYIHEATDNSSGFQAIGEINDPLIRKLVTSWTGEQQSSEEAFSIRHKDQSWWSGFRPLERANLNIWIGVMVPESDIIGGINQRRAGIWSVGGIIIAFVGGLTLWMIRRYGRSFDPTTHFDSSRPGESINNLITMGEGRTVEFKATMRMNLHTQKPGKEIEKAWLKSVAAFMNTNGGTILLGVRDDGEIAGLEQDHFDNEDKCKLHFKNLISQHIGAELTKHLRFTIVRLDGKQVGVVSCRRCTDPVFLKIGKNEAFYIRNGPSSDELSVSKVVAYIQKRT
ncbi:hypothetical protein D3OALGA1CA_4448 [Olavius algarvensis associated proteobacterium Delta 3]|nr:hypothetical protein D3OALGB2SA_3670 [Olavius algarvensis associated proteobacterium Delta 3]CAB5151430.1 hypothetical protein D3OALGA1CA_4448 [Olavius algarvensis associated proteobacterium Delta 3]